MPISVRRLLAIGMVVPIAIDRLDLVDLVVVEVKVALALAVASIRARGS
jgi:hypothetical protein